MTTKRIIITSMIFTQNPLSLSAVARGQSPAAGHAGPRDECVRESERALVQQLRSLCQDQAQQVQYLQAQLRKASLGLEVFAITTQHFCQKVRRRSALWFSATLKNCVLLEADEPTTWAIRHLATHRLDSSLVYISTSVLSMSPKNAQK